MAQSLFDLFDRTAMPLMAIERPRCPACQARMKLAKVSPGPKGFDNRTFECGRCELVQIASIAADPMKSPSAGWLSGSLRTPT